MSRYNWEGEEPWVKFKATDTDGQVQKFEREPEKASHGCWVRTAGDRAYDTSACPDWADSLEARPEPEAKPVKYDPEKLKPFDPDRALAGDPVCTAEGDPVSQLTRFDGENITSPWVGVVRGNLWTWKEGGMSLGNGVPRPSDLRMAPKKRMVWRNSFYYPNSPRVARHDDWASKDSAMRAVEGTEVPKCNIAVPVETEE